MKNPWDHDYYGVADALDELVTHFANKSNTDPSIEEVLQAVGPLFKLADVPNIGKSEKDALEAVRPLMRQRIQKRIVEISENTD